MKGTTKEWWKIWPRRIEARRGWECPKCERTYSLWVSECPHCQPKPTQRPRCDKTYEVCEKNDLITGE